MTAEVSQRGPDGLPELSDLTFTHPLVVLPESLDEDRAIYPGELDSLVKHLRADGIDAAYAHESDRRSWRILKGETELLAFAIAVASSALGNVSWDAIKASLGSWLGMVTSTKTKLSVSVAVDRAGDRDRRWVTITGQAPDVIESLDRVPALLGDDPGEQEGE